MSVTVADAMFGVSPLGGGLLLAGREAPAPRPAGDARTLRPTGRATGEAPVWRRRAGGRKSRLPQFGPRPHLPSALCVLQEVTRRCYKPLIPRGRSPLDL